MNRKLRIFILELTTLFLLSTSSVYAKSVISPLASTLVNDFMDLRMRMALCESDNEALGKIEEFFKQKYYPVKNSLSQQEQMIMMNFYYTERYNYMQHDETGGALITENELLSQISVNDEFFEKNKGKDIDGWTYTTSANVIGCYMSFHPVPAALKYGQKQKDYYLKAVQQNKDFWYGVSHYAQWCFFAPGIYDGGKKKAEKYFLQSLELAKTDAEKYYANIYMSQFYYQEGAKDKSTYYLDKADSYLPGGSYVAFIRKINSEGYSTFVYKDED